MAECGAPSCARSYNGVGSAGTDLRPVLQGLAYSQYFIIRHEGGLGNEPYGAIRLERRVSYTRIRLS